MTQSNSARNIAWHSHALSDVGCVREVNEDAILDQPGIKLWAVADGMGGHQIGDVASEKVIEHLQSLILNETQSLSESVDSIDDALINANTDLREHARRLFQNKTMGSTALCFFVKGNVGVVLWVGDSRLYRVRQGQLQQLTRDHSQVEALLQMGMITEAEAENHPHKNVITRAVGVEPHVFVDVNIFSTQVGDTFLLCSDGLYNEMSQEQITQKLCHPQVEACALDLMKTALQNGAQDNVSVVVVRGEHY